MEQQGPRSTEWYRLLPTYTADLVLELSEKASGDKKGWRMARSTAPDVSSAARARQPRAEVSPDSQHGAWLGEIIPGTLRQHQHLGQISSCTDSSSFTSQERELTAGGSRAPR